MDLQDSGVEDGERQQKADTPIEKLKGVTSILGQGIHKNGYADVAVLFNQLAGAENSAPGNGIKDDLRGPVNGSVKKIPGYHLIKGQRDRDPQ